MNEQIMACAEAMQVGRTIGSCKGRADLSREGSRTHLTSATLAMRAVIFPLQ
jgi:hypothetical protein